MGKYEALRSQKGTEMTEAAGTENAGVKQIRCIKIYSKGDSFWFPVDRIEAVLVSPEVVKVPEASEDLIGLSPYQKSMVPYFRVSGNTEGQGKSGHITTEIRCGILFWAYSGLTGIAADEISGETVVLEDDLKEQMPKRLAELLGGVQVD